MCAGDPTVFGNLPPAPNIAAAVKKVVDEGKHSGYGHSRGKSFSGYVHKFTIYKKPILFIALCLQVYQKLEQPWLASTVWSMVPH